MTRSHENLPAGLSSIAQETAAALRGGASATETLQHITPDQIAGALEETLALHESLPAGPGREATREILLGLLEAGRYPAFLLRISGTPLAGRWLAAVLRSIGQADVGLGDLLRLRATQKPEKTLIRTPAKGGSVTEWSRAAVGRRVDDIASGLLRVLDGKPRGAAVAILSPNRLETMLVDLACLSNGIVNVPIAADATPEQVHYILARTGPQILVAADQARVDTILSAGPLPAVRSVVLMDPPEEGRPLTGHRLLAEIEEEGRIAGGRLSSRVRSRDLATILFTSGTTGNPKGIRFSQRNIVFKRFCRAVALPEIGEDDDFLCFLPLFHTFGRWLEMTGCIFWGACYNAAENPSIEAVLAGMRRFRPTVFISIPKRWIQIREKALQTVGGGAPDPQELDPARVRAAVEETTGGRLRWGLSAAGYLDPDIFLFFQRNGIELLSGFGMTEATGGITMTPPGKYRRGTVGVALPGIEVRRAEDGELQARGPYMMLGYDEPEEGERDYETEWFSTGDLVAQDPDGYVTIVDRKKDIYKNVKGQTIAPAKIENLFDEFEEIKRSFLVGDGREYNTLLVYPDYDAAGGKLAKMQQDELREYLSSFVVSVNRFLAPYERVVDFDLLPRYFREDRGELTPKGTFIRKAIERNFADRIDSLYARSYITVAVDGIEVRVPTWLLREKGLTADTLVAESGGIRLRSTSERLTIARIPGSPGRYRIGSYIYTTPSPAGGTRVPPPVDLDPILRLPVFWTGNAELARFAGEGLLRRPRRGDLSPPPMSVEGFVRPGLALLDSARQSLDLLRRQGSRDPVAVHAAASVVLAANGDEARDVLDLLEGFLSPPASEEARITRAFLPVLRFHAEAGVRRRALLLLLSREPDERAAATVRSFLESDPALLSQDVRSEILSLDPPPAAVRSLLDLAQEIGVGHAARAMEAGRQRVSSLLRLAGEIAAAQPRWYAPVRQVLLGRGVPGTDPQTAAVADTERSRLDSAFRTWVSSGWIEPVDPEAGEPIPWARVIGFDARIDSGLCEKLLAAFRETTLLRESIFLLSEGSLVSGADLLPGGVWISRLGTGHGKTVVRVIVRTRQGRQHDFVIKIADEIGPAEMAEEADWMIRLSAVEGGGRLVAEFGGFWPEHGLWTEEYVSGETILAYLQRMTSRGDAERVRRAVALWPHLAWSALTSFVSFWQRTGRRIVVSDPGPGNIIVAPHDYQEGSRLISVSPRMGFDGIARMIRFLYESLVAATETEFPPLRGMVPRRIAFAGVIEAMPQQAAIPLLWRALAEARELATGLSDQAWREWQEDLGAYLGEIEREGYAPRRLEMAVRRYHAWSGLNPDASLTARAMMLQELYETYSLASLEARYPEIRVRFFRRTVFARARDPLAAELDAMIRAHRDTPLAMESLLRRMTMLHTSFPLNDEETYFLARLTYSHLTPGQRVHLELVEEGGEPKAELVEEIRDSDDAPLTIRGPSNPKEVIWLHRLFELSGLAVVFRPEHRMLLVLDERENVVGGLFYRSVDRDTAHMEKIVVGPRHRGKGVGERLMESFLQRMRDAGKRRATTGFFQPHYFYQFGFRLERGFAGLVKDLDVQEPDAAQEAGSGDR